MQNRREFLLSVGTVAAGVNALQPDNPTASLGAETEQALVPPTFWPPTPQFTVYVDGKSSTEIAHIRAVAFPTKVTIPKNGKFYLGGRWIAAYNGRGDRVDAVPVMPGANLYYEFFKNSAGYDDHTGYVEVKSQTTPTYQLYLQNLNKKTGVVILRCWPPIYIDDNGTKQSVYLRHVFADIEVTVL